MRRIAVMNQKGGVGKTTTTVNLSAALARSGKKVCVIDLDPQAHASTHLGIEQSPEQPSLYDVLVHSVPLPKVRSQVEENLTIIPSSIDLAAAEVELAGVVGRELLLRDLLAEDEQRSDYIVMDCPPSLGVLTLNALTAADEVIVPLQPHFLSLHGMSKLFETVQLVAKRLNPRLIISGVVLCLYETGTRLSAEVTKDLETFLEHSRGQTAAPWRDAVVYSTRIRRNIKLAEAASFGQPIFDYDRLSNGAKDYLALAKEVIQQEHQVVTAAAA
jgi:chromosome partitioning protein